MNSKENTLSALSLAMRECSNLPTISVAKSINLSIANFSKANSLLARKHIAIFQLPEYNNYWIIIITNTPAFVRKIKLACYLDTSVVCFQNIITFPTIYIGFHILYDITSQFQLEFNSSEPSAHIVIYLSKRSDGFYFEYVVEVVSLIYIDSSNFLISEGFRNLSSSPASWWEDLRFQPLHQERDQNLM